MERGRRWRWGGAVNADGGGVAHRACARPRLCHRAAPQQCMPKMMTFFFLPFLLFFSWWVGDHVLFCFAFLFFSLFPLQGLGVCLFSMAGRGAVVRG